MSIWNNLLWKICFWYLYFEVLRSRSTTKANLAFLPWCIRTITFSSSVSHFSCSASCVFFLDRWRHVQWYGGGSDYQQSGDLIYQPFIHSFQADNIQITGGGTIEGNGAPWWKCWRGDHKSSPCNGISRSHLINLVTGTNIEVGTCCMWCLLCDGCPFREAWSSNTMIVNIYLAIPKSVQSRPGHCVLILTNAWFMITWAQYTHESWFNDDELAWE